MTIPNPYNKHLFKQLIKQLVDQKGFSLIELLITIAIIGLLSSFFLNQSKTTVAKSQQVKAQQLLLNVMQQQQAYFSRNQRFTTQLSNLPALKDINEPDYQLSAVQCDTSYGDTSQCINLIATNKISNFKISLNNLGELNTIVTP